MSDIPQSYDEWVYCIEKKCRIPLTQDYILKRIQALEDKGSKEVKNFERLYGEAHRKNILSFFKRAQSERKNLAS